MDLGVRKVGDGFGSAEGCELEFVVFKGDVVFLFQADDDFKDAHRVHSEFLHDLGIVTDLLGGDLEEESLDHDLFYRLFDAFLAHAVSLIVCDGLP